MRASFRSPYAEKGAELWGEGSFWHVFNCSYIILLNPAPRARPHLLRGRHCGTAGKYTWPVPHYNLPVGLATIEWFWSITESLLADKKARLQARHRTEGQLEHSPVLQLVHLKNGSWLATPLQSLGWMTTLKIGLRMTKAWQPFVLTSVFRLSKEDGGK